MQNPIKFRRQPTHFIAILLMVSLFLPNAAFAVPQDKQMGELTVTGTVSVNGTPASTGTTVSRGSRIQTGTGQAVVNLGQLGSLNIQAETDFLLDFQESALKGTLTLGTIVLNLPNDVVANIMTPNGEVAVPSDQNPATLTVSVNLEGTQAFVKREQERPRSFRPYETTANKSRGKLTGELWTAGTTSVNGKPATTGMTILRGSRIQTGNASSAVVNFNQLGRISAQSDTDFFLDFQDSAVNGNLSTGTIVQNIPSGVAVNFSTPNGSGHILPNQTPARLSIITTPNDMRLFIRRESSQTAVGSCGRELSRAFRPSNPSPNGWLIPLLAVGGVGVIAAVTSLVTSSPNIIPLPPDLTPVVP